MSEQDVDVLVAGAGLAGATTALALAHAGLRVALVDPAGGGEGGDGRSSAVSYAPYRLWRALSVADRFEAVQPIVGIVVTEGRAASAAPRPPSPAWIGFDAAELSGEAAGEPLGYMVENRHAQAALAGALAEAGISVVREGVEVARADPGGVDVRLSGGGAIRAALVVAADGRNSRLRTGAGIGVVGWSYGQAALVASIAHGEPHGGIARQVFLPSGPLAVLPLTGDRSSLVWTETPERAAALARLPAEAFGALLLRRIGEVLGSVVRLDSPRWTHPLSLQLAEAHVGERLALVGDAACAVHPLAGQGLNLGLKDAAALVEVVGDAARLGEDIGTGVVLARYARRRRFDAASLAGATDLLQRTYAMADPLSRLVRGAGVAATHDAGPLRRFLMRQAGGATGDLPGLLRRR